MKTNKIKPFCIPVLLLILISFVQASSVMVFLVYDSTAENSLTIYDGDQIGFTVDANSVLENSMTVSVDLLDSSGNLVSNLIYVYKITDEFDEYYTHYTFGKAIYGGTGDYTIRAVVTGASGQTNTAELSLEVIEPKIENNLPVISSTPIQEINEGAFYNYQVIATDADEDTLTYSLTQNPSWVSINPDTGLITGTAPLLDSDYEYAITVRVSDGIDFDTQFFTLTVKDITEEDTTPPVITITYPEDGETYDSHITSLQYTVYDENLDACWYSTDSGATTTGVTCGETITGLESEEGENTWTVYARDTFNNEANESVTFNVEIEEDDDDDKKKHKNIGFRSVGFDEFELEEERTPIYLEDEIKEEVKEPSIEWGWIIFLIFLVIIILVIIILVRVLS